METKEENYDFTLFDFSIEDKKEKLRLQAYMKVYKTFYTISLKKFKQKKLWCVFKSKVSNFEFFLHK